MVSIEWGQWGQTIEKRRFSISHNYKFEYTGVRKDLNSINHGLFENTTQFYEATVTNWN